MTTTDLPEYAQALERVVTGVVALGDETVPLGEAHGRILAERIIADRDLPPFNRAMMDGYALRASEVRPGVSWPVETTIPAGRSAAVAVPPGRCVAIATGAPVPEDVDTVVQHELSDRADPVQLTIDSIEPGHAIHPRGSDARRGDLLLEPGVKIYPHHLGVAASVGKAGIRVSRRPRTTILTSGDEVRPAGEPVETHQITNSNGPMLAALLERFGAEVTTSRHVEDEVDPTIAAVEQAVRESDLVVTVGGVSAGERDYFPTAYARADVRMSLRGAAIQPGKPVQAGRAPSGCVVVGLPGNPVSVLATAHLFLWPLVHVMLGLPLNPPWEGRELAEPVKPNPKRQAFRPARLDADGRVVVPTWAGSGDLVHTGHTDGLVALPVQDDPVEAETPCAFLPWA